MRNDLLEDAALCHSLREDLAQRRGTARMDYANGTVTITVKQIRPSRKPHALADVAIELRVGGHSLVIDNVKVLPGRSGNWVAMPSYCISTSARDFKYFPTVVLSAGLAGDVSDVILKAYDEWMKEAPASSR